jgi:hypothetical protein
MRRRNPAELLLLNPGSPVSGGTIAKLQDYLRSLLTLMETDIRQFVEVLRRIDRYGAVVERVNEAFRQWQGDTYTLDEFSAHLGKAYFSDVEEEFKKIVSAKVDSFLWQLQKHGQETPEGELVVWRLLKNVDAVRQDKLGKHWTFVPNAEGGFVMYGGKRTFLLKASVPFEGIDLNETLLHLFTWYLTDEQEITISDESRLHLIEIIDLRGQRANPAASRLLTLLEVQQVMVDLAVPKAWRTRFMQGMEIEWREHGGGIDAHSVGSLVVDHLNEDVDYYRKPRQNPGVRIPKGMRPVIEAYGEQIAKLASRVIHEVTGEPLDVQWTPRTEPLGAGSWGVVYPTRDPRFVVKVTADPTEGPIVATIMSEPQLHNHMGIIHYFALRQLPENITFRGKTFPVFVIVAERLKDVGALRGWSKSREDEHLTRLLVKIKDVAGKLVHEKQKKRPSQRLIDILDEQYLDLVGQIHDGPISDFFFQFRDATDDGVLADVHLNNVGKRAVDWEAVTNGAVPLSGADWHWVISDPGHSSVEQHPEIAPLRENPRRRP